jgi:stress response protein YsnF
MSGPDIREAQHEEIVYEERPVVATETVPVERVRLEKQATTREETVGGQVRKEHIETEGADEDL